MVSKQGHIIMKVILLGGSILYGVVGNIIFSELHETDMTSALACSMVCFLACIFFLIAYVGYCTAYHLMRHEDRIMDLRLEVEELMEDVNALKKSQKSQNP